MSTFRYYAEIDMDAFEHNIRTQRSTVVKIQCFAQWLKQTATDTER